MTALLLADIRRGAVDDAADALERWISLGEDGNDPSEDAVEASQDLLAGWVRLERMAPAGEEPLWPVRAAVRIRVALDAAALARAAWAEPPCPEWLHRAGLLALAMEEEPEGLAGRALQLLEEADRAALLGVALARLGFPGPSGDAEAAAVQAAPELFAGAGEAAEAVLASFRADLPPDLAETAKPWKAVAAAFAEMKAEALLPPWLEPEIARAALAKVRGLQGGGR